MTNLTWLSSGSLRLAVASQLQKRLNRPQSNPFITKCQWHKPARTPDITTPLCSRFFLSFPFSFLFMVCSVLDWLNAARARYE
ncbi:hypothetical protein K440DRAFT_380071 [Wilcoxina mikolae CBS 423.85]|nr:hypothetical protein K440DRAFT_380071 [Wilcoxina mikolae CBS 423.85]